MRNNPLNNANIKLINTKKLLVVFSFILVIFGGLPLAARAEGASLYLSPASGSFFVGSTFDVSVFVNTGQENVNAVETNIEFDPNKLQVASPTAGKSFIEIWVAQPDYSNTKGRMSFIGGIPSPGINTSAGLVSTITFRAIAPGQAKISFLDSSKVLRNDSAGTNILTSIGRGVYTLLIPPPEGPKVFSPTHPDRNKWYKDNNPTFSWEKEQGVTNFSYSFDRDSTGVPDNEPEGEHTSVSFSEVKDGIWYFHIKAQKGKVWGGTSHYVVQIDTTIPAAFEPTVEPFVKTTEKQPLISFITTDALSGIDYYQIKYIDITPERKEEGAGFFVEATSPHKLPLLEIGKYLIVIRAYDKAGNWREGTVKIQIFPKGLLFTKKGIQYKAISIPWWLLLIILIIILVLLGLELWRRQQAMSGEKKDKLNKVEKRIKRYREEALRRIKKKE